MNTGSYTVESYNDNGTCCSKNDCTVALLTLNMLHMNNLIFFLKKLLRTTAAISRNY
jgi:hypothetical protein